MRAFIAWSGDRSRQVAETFREYLPIIIQPVMPFVSSRDVQKGAAWAEELRGKLQETGLGVICLTADNLDSSWIHFEAGALSNSPKARVCTFLLDLKAGDVPPPLGTFQHTAFDEADVWQLLTTINSKVGEVGGQARAEDELKRVFDKFWPEWRERLASIADSARKKPARRARPDRDLLEEILATVRSLERRFSDYDRQFSLFDETPEISGPGVSRLSRARLESLAAALPASSRSVVLPSSTGDSEAKFRALLARLRELEPSERAQALLSDTTLSSPSEDG